MIEGLKLSLTTEQLKTLCQKRAEYHAQRHEHFQKKAETERAEQEEASEMAAEIGKYANSMAMVRGQTAAERAKHHLDRATFFRFFMTYLVPNETFILTQQDLHTIEVLAPY